MNLLEAMTVYKLTDITYEFLEPRELSSPTQCVITTHLSRDNEPSYKSYKLTGVELNPDYMTTDRLYEVLSERLDEYGVTGFSDMLGNFVIDFVTCLRKMGALHG